MYNYSHQSKCQDPSHLFWCSDLIKFRPYSILTDLASKTIVYDANISLMDFAYLVACRPSVLIYRSGYLIYAEVYRYARFCRKLGYNQ